MVDGLVRRIDKLDEIKEMPNELKKLLETKIIMPSTPLKTFSEKLGEDIKSSNFNMDLIGEGNRNNFLVHLGGILRKELNISQTYWVLNMLNKHFCNPPLNQRELENLIKILDKYCVFDESELSQKILSYLKIVEEGNSRDIKEVIGEPKEKIEKALQFLVKEAI